MRHRFAQLFALLVSLVSLVLSSAPPLAAAVDRWSPWGPPLRWTVQLVADPEVPGRLFALAGEPMRAGSVYRSSDGGRTWAWSGTGLASAPVDRLAVSRDGTLWAFTDKAGLFRSTDGALTWRLHAAEARCDIPGFPTQRASELVISESTPRAIYAVCGGLLLAGDDDGAHWEQRGLPWYQPHVGVDPGDRHHLFAGADGVFFESRDGGRSWQDRRASIGDLPLQGLTAVAGPQPALFAFGAWLLRTVDAGASWQQLSLGPTPPGSSIEALEADPRRPGRLLAVFRGGGALCSDDLGEHWEPCLDPLEPPFREFFWSGAWGAEPDTFYVSTGRELRRVVAGEVSPERLSAGFGLDFQLAPVEGGLLALAGGDLFFGLEGGGRWSALPDVVPRPDEHGTLGAVGVDPFRPGHWVALSTSAGIHESFDRGATWRLLRDTPALAIALPEPRTILVGGCGLQRSADGGRTWQSVLPCQSGFLAGEGTVRSFTTSSRRGGPLFARVDSSCDVSASVCVQYLRSTNGGRTWRRVLTGAEALAADPHQPGALWALTRGQLLRSIDDGTRWSFVANVPLSQAGVFDLDVDPRRPGHLVATTFGAGVIRSTDGGRSWASVLQGLPQRVRGSVRTLVFDPAGADRLYLMTAAGGYWVRFTEGGPSLDQEFP